MTSSFDVPLRFGPARSDLAMKGAVEPSLRYEVLPPEIDQTRSDARLLLKPAIDLDLFDYRAVIDWIWVEFETARETQSVWISNWIQKETGRRPYVGGPGTEHDAKHARNITGKSFRAKIQEPTPETMRLFEGAVRGQAGLMRSPRIIGIEIAIDFFPKCTSDELRWRMVGALHRHHWAKPELFNGPMADLHHTYAVAKKNVATASTASRPGAGPEDAEAAGEGAGTLTRTNYVIREPEDFVDDRLKAGGGKAREHSDFDLGREDVRDRVLRLEGHRAPFIDSTVYRGASDAPVLIRIQNKVTDRRNPEAGTWEDLGPESRRARIEVRLLHDAVREAGFRDLEDLRGFRFQGLRKDFFGLWLPMIPGGPNAKGMVGPGQDYRGRQQQRLFAASGVYGFKLDELAREERTKAMRRKFKDEGEEIGQRPDYRFAKRNHLKAWAEMNDKVDTALRRLTREWGR